jgi:hypothetical protein
MSLVYYGTVWRDAVGSASRRGARAKRELVEDRPGPFYSGEAIARNVNEAVEIRMRAERKRANAPGHAEEQGAGRIGRKVTGRSFDAHFARVELIRESTRVVDDMRGVRVCLNRRRSPVGKDAPKEFVG